jgi:hypothetical protein
LYQRTCKHPCCYPSLSFSLSLCQSTQSGVLSYTMQLRLCVKCCDFYFLGVPWNSWTQLSGTED